MTLLERDERMREEGREEGRAEERINTRREAARADAAEEELMRMRAKLAAYEDKYGPSDL